MKHRCHARGCTTEVPPRMFMCYLHWRKVPKKDRDLVWALYYPGQEITKDPSAQYVQETQRIIDELAAKEAVTVRGDK